MSRFSTVVKALRPGAGIATGDRLSGAVAHALETERAHGRFALFAGPLIGLGAGAALAVPIAPPAILIYGALLVAALSAVVFRNRTPAGPIAAALLAIALGAAAVDVAIRRVEGPRLDAELTTRTVIGRVVRVEAMASGTTRLTLEAVRIEGLGPDRTPGRVIVSGRALGAPAVGAGVAVQARLGPHPGPTHPGAYDPAFVRFFDGVGASGLAFGRAAPAEVAPAEGIEAALIALEALRMDLTRRIRDAIPGQTGAIAASLVTGERSGISVETNALFNASGLLHVLSISGLHLALMVGATFLIVRGGLALVPAVAVAWPIKKIAATAAILVATGYLAISGAAVAAVRAYVMALVMLGAVLVDRPAFSMRNVMLAGAGILLVTPDQIASASFQMSFAATAAIIAGVERGWFPRFGAPEAGWIERGLRALFALAAANLVMSALAEAAILPFALHHFHRVAWYGFLGNLLSFLIVDLWIMPAVLATLIAFPLGLEAWALPVLGAGVEQLHAVARFVGAFERAVSLVPGHGLATTIAAGAAITIAVVFRTWLALLAVPVYAAALLIGAFERGPDIRVSARGEAVAVRGPDGRYAVIDARRARFAVGRWLEADGDRRTARDPGLEDGALCDPLGCTVRLPGGPVVAVVKRVEAFEEDCRRADVIVSALQAPPRCPRPALVLDRGTILAAAGLEATRTGSGWQVASVRARCGERPWCPPGARRDGQAAVEPASAATEDDQ